MNPDPDNYLFQQGDKVYYWLAMLLPREMHTDVIDMHSFLRTAHTYANWVPSRRHEFRSLSAAWLQYRGGSEKELAPDKDDALNVRVTKNMCRLVARQKLDPSLVDAFLYAMELDTRKKTYYSLDDTMRYLYGSAEAPARMTAQIMGLPEDAMEAATAQGRALQWLSFVRDIARNVERGRVYFPQSDLAQFKLPDLGELTAKAHADAFREFVRFEIGRYREWQGEALHGIDRLPRRRQTVVRSLVDTHQWLARRVAKDPFVVYHKQLHPSKVRVAGNVIVHLFD